MIIFTFRQEEQVYSKQFSFGSKRSTIDALAEIRVLIHFNVYCLIWVEHLIPSIMKFSLAKLEKFVVRGVCFKWLESISKERRQSLHVNDVLSDFLFLLVGVPQCSILVPLLFSSYTKDQPGACEFLNSILFADDRHLI